MYAGEKRDEGIPVEQAGLVGGTLYGIKVAGGLGESSNPAFPLTSTFSLAEFEDADPLNVSELQTASEAAGVTEFWRPEDGHWDTTDPNVFWFATTAKFDGPTRLWKLTFADVSNPARAATIEAVLDGTEGLQMLDNMTVADKGGNCSCRRTRATSPTWPACTATTRGPTGLPRSLSTTPPGSPPAQPGS